jgi:hypothetical protein
MHGSEVRTLRKSDENTLAMWEIEILRRIFAPVKEHGASRISTKQQLMSLCRKPDIISEIIKGRLTWLVYVEKMTEEKTVDTKRSVGNPRNKWLKEVENALKKTDVRNN